MSSTIFQRRAIFLPYARFFKILGAIAPELLCIAPDQKRVMHIDRFLTVHIDTN